MPLNTTPEQFKQAYINHKKTKEELEAKKDELKITYALTMFYAVECGLKYHWLKGQHKDWNSIPSHSKPRNGHNLTELAQKAGLNYTFHSPIKLADGADCSIEQVHEAWRYAIPMKSSDQDRLIADLQHALNRLTKVIR